MNENLLSIVKIIRAKMNMIVLALFISTSMIAGWSVLQLLIEQPYLHETEDIVERVAKDDLRLLRIMQEIRYDVLQVQQHLTDISATRGQDGLADGLKEAEWYAGEFKKHIAQALEITSALNLTEVGKGLERVARKFDAYLEEGKTMAQAYISGGAAEGNKLMPAFDSSTTGMTLAVINQVDLVEENTANELLAAEESIDTLIENNQAMLLFALFPAVLGLIAAIYGMVAIRRIIRVLSDDNQG